MTAEFLLFLGVGKLLIYLGQKFIHSNAKNEFINKLFACDLCLGVWIYSILAMMYKINILSDVFPYIPIVSGIIAGCVASFVVHLATIGWKTKFEVIEI